MKYLDVSEEDQEILRYLSFDPVYMSKEDNWCVVSIALRIFSKYEPTETVGAVQVIHENDK